MSSNNKNRDTDPSKSEYEIIKVPKEHLDLIMETLYLDSDSSMYDNDMKIALVNAIDSIDLVSEYNVKNLLGLPTSDYDEIIGKNGETFLGLRLSKLEDNHVFGTDKVDPENMPTCDGCGGQKEHPTKEFSYPPENGLCDNELNECVDLFDAMAEHYGVHGLPIKSNEPKMEYYEGEPCPFCDKDYNEDCDNSLFFSHSEGGGYGDLNDHYYYCPHCDKSWVNISSFITKEVK